MAILPRDPRDQYRMLGVVLLLALGALYYLYLHKPKGNELLEVQQRVEEIEQQNRLAEERTENLEMLRQQLASGEREFAILERLVPARSEVPAIYEEIASQSQQLGLELVNVVPADPLPDTSGYFLEQNWQMEVEGQYHDIGDFLTRVASLPRIVRPQVNEIKPTQRTPSGKQLVSARFGLQTYVLPPPGSQSGEGGSDED